MISAALLALGALAATAQAQSSAVYAQKYTEGFDYFTNSTQYDIGNVDGLSWNQFFPNNQQKGFTIPSKPTIAWITQNQTGQATITQGNNPPSNSFDLKSLYFVCAKSLGQKNYPGATAANCTVSLVGTSSVKKNVKVTQTLTYTAKAGNTAFQLVNLASGFSGNNITNVKVNVTSTTPKNAPLAAALFDNVTYIAYIPSDG